MNMIRNIGLFLIILVAVTVISSNLFSLQAPHNDLSLTGSAVSKFVYIPPPVITEDVALDALIKAEKDIGEISSLGINTFLTNDTLLIAKRYFIGITADRLLITTSVNADKSAYLASLLKVFISTPQNEVKTQNFSETVRLTQLISFDKDQAYKIIDRISLAEEKQNNYKKEGVNISEGAALIKQARTSLIEERFDEAENILDDANIKLDQTKLQEARFKSIFEGTQNLFQKYWWQSILVIILLAAASPIAVLFVRRISAKRKLVLLKHELESLKTLLIKAQEDCFKYKTITISSYKIKADSYKERINELQILIPVLESASKGEKTPENK